MPFDFLPMGGLEAGETYFVRVVDARTIELSQQPLIGLDNSAVNAGSVHRLHMADATVFALDPFDLSDFTLRLVGHGLSNGDVVTYSNSGNGDIGGLTAGESYRVVDADAEYFGLVALDGMRIEMEQDGALGRHEFAAMGGATPAIVLAELDAETNIISLADHGWQDDEAVVYSVAGVAQNGIGGLGVSLEYFVKRIDDARFQLLDAVGGDIVDLGDPADAESHIFVFQKSVLSFAADTDVSSETATITIADHGYTTGDYIVYAVDDSVESVGQTTRIDLTDPDNPVLDLIEVRAADRAIRGLVAGGVYVVVVEDQNTIRLARSMLEAEQGGAINLTSNGTGDSHSLGPSKETVGIGITASLKASNTVSSAPALGATFSKTAFTSPELSSDFLIPVLLQQKDAFGDAIKTKQGDIASKTDDNGFSAGAAVAINVGRNVVKAELSEATLVSGVDILVSAQIEENISTSAGASVSTPEGSEDTIVAVAIAVSAFKNEAYATVTDNSVLDAAGAITVSTAITYPLARDPEDLTKVGTWVDTGLVFHV